MSDGTPAPHEGTGAGGRGCVRAQAHAAGVSIIEVLVVLGLLALFVLIAEPSLVVPSQVQVGATSRQVAGDLGLARRLAIASHLNYVVTFSPSSGPYTSYTVGPGGGAPGPDFPKTFPAGIVVTGTQRITYLPSGAATASAALTLTAGAATAQVQVVAATGFIQVTGP